MRQRKGAYPPEFRQQMVELVRVGRKPSELAQEFGCHETSISAWVRQAKVDEMGGSRPDAPLVNIEMNSIDAILQMVSNTHLATIQTPRLTHGNDQLMAIPIRPVIMRSAGIVTRRGVNLSPAARIVVDMLRKDFLDGVLKLNSLAMQTVQASQSAQSQPGARSRRTRAK